MGPAHTLHVRIVAAVLKGPHDGRADFRALNLMVALTRHMFQLG